MEFRVLGPLEVVSAGKPVALGSAKQRAVLALLILQAPEPVSVERLVDELWGERPPTTAQHAVQVYVSEIRKALSGALAGADEVVATCPSGYALEVEAERIDARRFERLLGDAQMVLGDEPARARGLFEEALALWRGLPLAEFQLFGVAARDADRLDQLRVRAAEGLVEARLACGEHAELVGAISALVAADPLRERPRRQLMLALYRNGRHAEALGAYRDGCEALDEIGLEPGPELRQLEQAILRHDPSLSAPSPVAGLETEKVGLSGAVAAQPAIGARGLPVAGKVTMLFTDIEGSTELLDRLGDGYPELLAEHHRVIREAIAATGGYEIKVTGDSFFVAFADARKALECARRAQLGLTGQRWPGDEAVRVRMGIHTGAPALRDGDYVGIDVHRAARVMAVAHGGQVLLTEPTRDALPRSVELLDLGHHRLKDLPAPERLFQLLAPDLPEDFLPLRSLNRTNLPADPRPLVGREAELARVCGLLSDGDRLVTLVGTGGVGKTRLALAAARRLVAELAGGAFLVSLAAVGDPAGVLPAVAQALGVREIEGDPLRPVLVRLADQPTLLILDNFEQILAAGPLVGELVAAAPVLRVLVTSQAPLRIGAETVMGVDALTSSAALELFIERAAAAARGEEVSEVERSVVSEICERVGRLPLAVELAAARIGVLAPAELLQRLQKSSTVLRSAARDAPERQRSLHATLEWTHAALTEPQRVLFRRLGVFAGPVRLSAIEAVADQPAGDHERLDTLDALEGLVDISLVHRDQSPVGGRRFSMPQTLREFAREKLADANERDAVSRRHAEHIADIADASRVWVTASAAERERLIALDAELIPALEWAEHHDRELHRRLVAGLGIMLLFRGRMREVNDHLARALEGRIVPHTALDAWLGNLRVSQLCLTGRLDEAQAAIEPVMVFARESDDVRLLALILDNATGLHWELGEMSAAMATAAERLELLRRAGERSLLPAGLLMFAQTLIFAGRLDEAEQLLDEAVNQVEEPGPMIAIGIASERADIALGRGDHTQALKLYAASLALSEQAGEWIQAVTDAASVASLLSLCGHTEAALEADALVAAIARDLGHDGGNAQKLMFHETPTAAMREAAATHGADAARRAASVPRTDRVARIVALARAAH